MHSTTNISERELQLRSIQLQQIAAQALLKISTTLNDVLVELRKQNRDRNGTDSNSKANGTRTCGNSERHKSLAASIKKNENVLR
jgi:hypothetical protein